MWFLELIEMMEGERVRQGNTSLNPNAHDDLLLDALNLWKDVIHFQKKLETEFKSPKNQNHSDSKPVNLTPQNLFCQIEQQLKQYIDQSLSKISSMLACKDNTLTNRNNKTKISTNTKLCSTLNFCFKTINTTSPEHRVTTHSKSKSKGKKVIFYHIHM